MAFAVTSVKEIIVTAAACIAVILAVAGFLFLKSDPPKKSGDPLSASEREWLEKHPVIRYAPDPDFEPVEFFAENGVYKGLTADYLARLEKVLGLRFQIVRLKTWSQVIEKAKRREVDVYAATRTPQRARYMLFTKPFTELPAVIIVRGKQSRNLTLDDLDGRTVSVVAEYAAHNFIAFSHPNISLDVVPDVKTGLRKVSFGLSDYFVENIATATFCMGKQPIANLTVAGECGFSYNMGFASRSDWPELDTILQKGLDKIRVADKKAMQSKWVTFDQPFYRGRNFLKIVYAAFAAVLIAVTVVTVWNRTLRREVDRRTAEFERELSERKQAEEALRESEGKFRVLAGTTPAGIVLYQDEQMLHVNDAAMKLFGYSKNEWRNMKFWEFAHEDSREMIRQRGLARQQGEQVPSQYECKYVTKQGRELWLLLSAGRIEYRGAPAGIVTFFDITDRKRMEEELKQAHDELELRVAERTAQLQETVYALRESESASGALTAQLDRKRSLLRTLIDTIPDLIFYRNREGAYLGCNRAFQDCTGFIEGEIVGKRNSDLFPSEVPGSFAEMDNTFLTEDSIRQTEEWVDYQDGRHVLLETTQIPFQSSDGEILGTIGISHDITRLKKTEASLLKQKEKLEELNATLEERIAQEVSRNREKDSILIQQNRHAALGELLNHIAHQWKQPLNSINILAYMMQSDHSSGILTEDSVEETVNRITTLVEHMAQTVDVFRNFYRPDKEVTPFRVRDAIDTALSFIEPAFRVNGITVRVDADPEVTATGYPKEYTQVLLNILTNAIDAFKEKRMSDPRIWIELRREDNTAALTVTDNAGGIPECIVDRIFDFQFTTKAATGGTGIGLYMSRNIIEKNMGGKLTASNVRDGARFSINLATSCPPSATTGG